MDKSGVRSTVYFLFPALSLVVFVFGVPLASLVYYSLGSWDWINVGPPLGLHSYAEVIREPQVLGSLIRTLILGAGTIPATVVISVVVAHFLYQKIFGWQFYLVVFFIPIILPIVVIGVVFRHFYTPDGILNHILRSVGLGMFTRAWLANVKTALPSVIVTGIWWEIAFATIIFYARMMTINPSLYEAAQVDGAKERQLIYHVTLPQLKGVIQFYVVLAIIYYLNQPFTYIFVMTFGGPGWATTTLDFLIYLNAFKYMRFGMASALSLLLLVVILLLVQVYFSMSKQEDIQ